jgi:hypothetical protein
VGGLRILRQRLFARRRRTLIAKNLRPVMLHQGVKPRGINRCIGFWFLQYVRPPNHFMENYMRAIVNAILALWPFGA